MTFIEMKNKDIKILKEKLYHKNNKKCPLLGIEVPLEKMALDHIHKLKSEPCDVDKGVIRNSIEFRANTIEGTIHNKWKRLYGSDPSKHPVDLPTFLRNLADYLEKGAYCENGKYFIHPSEVKKLPKLKKSCYNKLKKVYNGRAKFPDYPKSKKLTKKLEILFKKYNIDIEYYSL